MPVLNQLVEEEMRYIAGIAAHTTNPVEEGIRMLTQKLSLNDT